MTHGTFDAQICRQIQQSNTLVVGTSMMYGAGVYAYYPDRIPQHQRGDAFVIFQALPVRAALEIGAMYIRRGIGPDVRFFVLRGAIGVAISIALLGFVNCPGFPGYPGQLYSV